MSGDFVSVRILAVCASEHDGDLLRQGSALAAIPAYFTHVATAAAARAALAEGNVDIALLDSAMAERDLKDIFTAVRAARSPPAVVLVAPTGEAVVDLAGVADAIAVKPPKLQDAKALIESCMRLKVPSRVLVVDDSSTMRSIVRKISPAGCRFPVDTSEATLSTASMRSSRSAPASSISSFSTTTCRGWPASRCCRSSGDNIRAPRS